MAEESKSPEPEQQPVSVSADAPPVTPLAQQDAENAAADDDGSMTLIAHLTELRSRLIKCLLAVAVGSGVGYYFIDDIMHYLTVPVGKLYYMQPAEAFFTYIKIAVVVGFLLALPVIFYHVWRFFLPALTPAERLVLGIIVPVSVILFFLGLAFSFGILRAGVAITGNVPSIAWWLFFANVFWTLAYDTLYAMADKEDDLKIGIKTSAITFGSYDAEAAMFCHGIFDILMIQVGSQLGAAWVYWAALILVVYWPELCSPRIQP